MVGKILRKISLCDGYLISTNVDSHKSNKGNFDDASNALQKRLAKVSIADHSGMEDTAQGGHIYKASVFEALRVSKPGSRPPTLDPLLTSPDVSTSRKAKQSPRVYDPKAHYRIVFKERGQSLHSMSRGHEIKPGLVVKAMRDILKGSMILSDSASESF